MLGSSSLASVAIAAGRFVITIPTVVTATIGRPSADVSQGTWRASTGSDLYDMINEAVADASDYIYTDTLGTCELALNATVSPGTTLSYMASSSMGNGLTVRILVDGVIVATWAHGLTAVDTLYTHTISAVQAAQMATGAATVQLTGT